MDEGSLGIYKKSYRWKSAPQRRDEKAVATRNFMTAMLIERFEFHYHICQLKMKYHNSHNFFMYPYV